MFLLPVSVFRANGEQAHERGTSQINVQTVEIGGKYVANNTNYEIPTIDGNKGAKQP